MRRRSKRRVRQSARLSAYLRSAEAFEEGGFFYSPRMPKDVDSEYWDNPELKSSMKFSETETS